MKKGEQEIKINVEMKEFPGYFLDYLECLDKDEGIDILRRFGRGGREMDKQRQCQILS